MVYMIAKILVVSKVSAIMSPKHSSDVLRHFYHIFKDIQSERHQLHLIFDFVYMIFL